MKRILVVLALLAMVTVGVFAQIATDDHTVTIDIAAIAAMALESGINIDFTTVDPVLPGDPVGPPVGTPQTGADRLFYTALNDAGLDRNITVETDVAVPDWHHPHRPGHRGRWCGNHRRHDHLQQCRRDRRDPARDRDRQCGHRENRLLSAVPVLATPSGSPTLRCS